jgi:pimeloyl-ACP methyl ester carboxylesterase
MADPAAARPGRPHLRRDDQQWVYDYVIQQSGLTYHWWSEERSLPAEVRSQRMISKHLGLRALRHEESAARKAAEGDQAAALASYFQATRDFMKAQHAVLELNAEKHFLYSGLERCFEKVRQLSAYPIERVETEWEGTVVGGWLHVSPGPGAAPLLFNVPGCDTTCEGSPNPADVREHLRGWHVFSFDGPGLGQSNMRGIALTEENFERAASAALDALLRRPDVDPDRVIVYGGGAGSLWATQFALRDRRVRALATKSGYSSLHYLMNEDAPSYKRLYGFLTQAATEAELDQVLAKMTVDGRLGQLRCPMLMVTGEYDLRDPVEDVFSLFDQLAAPAELWLFADQFHRTNFAGKRKIYDAVLDWLEERLAGIPLPAGGNQVRYIELAAEGLAGPHVSFKRRWFEEGKPTALAAPAGWRADAADQVALRCPSPLWGRTPGSAD